MLLQYMYCTRTNKRTLLYICTFSTQTLLLIKTIPSLESIKYFLLVFGHVSRALSKTIRSSVAIIAKWIRVYFCMCQFRFSLEMQGTFGRLTIKWNWQSTEHYKYMYLYGGELLKFFVKSPKFRCSRRLADPGRTPSTSLSSGCCPRPLPSPPPSSRSCGPGKRTHTGRGTYPYR
jgi:hypothetical protein